MLVTAFVLSIVNTVILFLLVVGLIIEIFD